MTEVGPEEDRDAVDEQALADIPAALATLGGLRRSVDGLEEQAKRLVSRDFVESWQRDQETKRRNFAALVIATGICFIILFAFLGYGVYVVSHLVEQVRQNTETTVNCTDPSLEAPCYKSRLRAGDKQRDEQTQEIVDGIVDRILKYYREGVFNQ